jgi:uncharacterized protein
LPEPLLLTTEDGLHLEAVVDTPDEGGHGPGLVFCHPHPQMGGTMNAPLLLAVRDEFVSRGWTVLRFNFRGIGASEGTSSEGIEELKDADAAIQALMERQDGLISIAGWSFGGAVALRSALTHPELVGCATIAPAIVPRPGITAGAPPATGYTFAGRTLVICGANDDQVAPAECRAWAAEAGAIYEEVRGANHFFWGKYEQLATKVADFLDADASD